MSKINFKLKIVAFTVRQGRLKLFLTKGDGERLSLPQGELNREESLEKAVERIIKEALYFYQRDEYIEQLYTFAKVKGSSTYIDIVYYILLPYERIVEAVLEYFFSIKNKAVIKSLDNKLIQYAVQRLGWKLEYTNVVYSLMPQEFTLSEIQTTYEAIFGKKLDKRNFRRKILSLRLLKNTGKKKKGEIARPASLYSFKHRRPVIVKVFS